MKSLIAQKKWVYDSAISTLFGLIDSKITVTFDATFLMLLRPAKHNKVIQSASYYLHYQCSLSRISRLLVRLRHFQITVILILNRDYTGNENHCGLSVLGKNRTYSSLGLDGLPPIISKSITRHEFSGRIYELKIEFVRWFMNCNLDKI